LRLVRGRALVFATKTRCLPRREVAGPNLCHFSSFDEASHGWYEHRKCAHAVGLAPLIEVEMGFIKGLYGSAIAMAKLGQVVALGAVIVSMTAAVQASTVPPNNTKLTTKTEVFGSKRIVPILTEDSTGQLERLAERYRDIMREGGWPLVPNGSFKKGKSGKGIATLNLRLYTEGYLRPEATQGEFEEVYTSATEDAVRRFQRNHGIEISGKIDKSTIRELNVPVAARLATIEANVERLRKYAENLGGRYLVVNVPSQQIESVSNGYVHSRHNAIVGRPDRPTPVVAAALSDVIFNPYWNAPASIVERDLIPKLQKSGTGVLEEMNIKVFQGFNGPEVDPKEVDWDTAVADDYHFRQEPGDGNAMATAKINFSSPFGIYLHDTPDKHYFKTGHRFYSSGCVRVEQVGVLLNWVLNGQDGYGQSQIAALAETQENTEVKLVTPPQLRVTYLTAYPVGDTVAFYNDIYELDGTGFVVGQPLPVGETSEDGQRFVLKPVARKASAVDAAEADGFNLQTSGKSKSKPTIKPKTTGGLYEGDLLSDESNLVETPIIKKSPKPKALPKTLPEEPVVEIKKPAVKTQAAVKSVAAAQPKQAKVLTNKKKVPGLFDWEAYRKRQNQEAKTKPGKKIVAKKTTSTSCKPDLAGKLPKGCPAVATAEKKKQ
jgi:L,D-transpeptidase YcbB